MPLITVLMYCFHSTEHYPNDLTIFDTLHSMYYLSVGSAAEFTCLAIANDVNNLEYYYRRTDGNPLSDNVVTPVHDGTTIDAHTAMFINEVTEANEGEYECVVRNITGDGNIIILSRVNFSISVSGKSVVLYTKL